MSEVVTEPSNPITWEADPPPIVEEPAEATSDAEKPEEPKPAPKPVLPETTTGGAPYWAIVPQGLVVPKGRAIFFVRFPSPWTDTPHDGIEGAITDEDAAGFVAQGVAVPRLWRQACFWALSIGDQKLALQRANGDQNRFNTELTKQMIRSEERRVGKECRS